MIIITPRKKRIISPALPILFLVGLLTGVFIGWRFFSSHGFPNFKQATSVVITNHESKQIGIYHSDKQEWFLVDLKGNGEVVDEKNILSIFSTTKQAPKEIKKNE